MMTIMHLCMVFVGIFHKTMSTEISMDIQLMCTSSLIISCNGGRASYGMYLFYRQRANVYGWQHMVKVLYNEKECKQSVSSTYVQCKCLDGVGCSIYDKDNANQGDSWYCTRSINGTLTTTTKVEVPNQDTKECTTPPFPEHVTEKETIIISNLSIATMTVTETVGSSTASGGTVENVTETSNFFNNTNVLVASAVSVGFVLIAAVISISVFVYRKYIAQSGDVVEERRTPIPIDITSITDCIPEIHTNARQGVHSYVEIIPSTPPPHHTDIEMSNDVDLLDENSEPSSMESTTSINHYERIPMPIRSAKRGSDDKSQIEMRSISLTDNTVSKEYSCADIHHGNIFQSVQMDTLADIAVITDITEGTVALRNRGSDEYRYESLIGTRFDKSQYNVFHCQQGGN